MTLREALDRYAFACREHGRLASLYLRDGIYADAAERAQRQESIERENVDRIMVPTQHEDAT